MNQFKSSMTKITSFTEDIHIVEVLSSEDPRNKSIDAEKARSSEIQNSIRRGTWKHVPKKDITLTLI